MCELCAIASRYQHVEREETLVFDLTRFAAALNDNQPSRLSTATEKSPPDVLVPDLKMQSLSVSQQGTNMQPVYRSAHYECNPIFIDDISSQIIEDKIAKNGSAQSRERRVMKKRN